MLLAETKELGWIPHQNIKNNIERESLESETINLSFLISLSLRVRKLKRHELL